MKLSSKGGTDLTIADIASRDPDAAATLLRVAGDNGTMKTVVTNTLLSQAGSSAYDAYVNVANAAAHEKDEKTVKTAKVVISVAAEAAVIGAAFLISPPVGWAVLGLTAAVFVDAVIRQA